METIKLYKARNCWIARFPENSRTALIIGTTEVPTAFTERAPFELVRSQIAQMNPEYSVQALEQ